MEIVLKLSTDHSIKGYSRIKNIIEPFNRNPREFFYICKICVSHIDFNNENLIYHLNKENNDNIIIGSESYYDDIFLNMNIKYNKEEYNSKDIIKNNGYGKEGFRLNKMYSCFDKISQHTVFTKGKVKKIIKEETHWIFNINLKKIIIPINFLFNYYTKNEKFSNRENTCDINKYNLIHVLTNNKFANISNICTLDKIDDNTGILYFIKPSKSIKNNEKVYKIGMTKRALHERLRQYNNMNSIKIYHTIIVSNVATKEKMLKILFKKHFKQRLDYGIEYFEG